jgi:hypothetical protein
VLDLVHDRDSFMLGILDQIVVAEGWVDSDVDVLVDGRGYDRTAVVAVVGR